MHRLLHVLLLTIGVVPTASSVPHGAVPSITDYYCQASSGTFTDSRDGEVYRWVRLGDQVWIAENLRFNAGEGCWAWNNDETTVTERGRYYTWEAAVRSVPPGCHLPTDEEWKQLEQFLGMSREEVGMEGDRGNPERILAGRLKAIGQWATEFRGNHVPVSDDTGFSALPIGIRAQEQFFHEGYCAYWSSSAEGVQAWIRFLHFYDDTITRILNNKEFAFSIRLLKDP
jgi:uncharacterized protein (TIGR02145 family)